MQTAIIVGYLLLMLGLGLYFARSRVKGSADFMVAGRSLSYGVLIGTLIAALVWRGASVPGGIASIAVGGVATLVWEIGLNKPLDWNSVLVSLPLSIVALVVVSLLTQKQRSPGIGKE